MAFSTVGSIRAAVVLDVARALLRGGLVDKGVTLSKNELAGVLPCGIEHCNLHFEGTRWVIALVYTRSGSSESLVIARVSTLLALGGISRCTTKEKGVVC